MKVIVAKSAGFCFGVERACETVRSILPDDRVYLLGELIHNKRVMNEFIGLGAKIVNNIDEIPDGATVVIRAHGVPKAVLDKLSEKNIKICDATCPYVKKIHKIVSEESGKGRKIIIFGKKEHPEVIGISGWCKDAVISMDISEIPEKVGKNDQISIVAQTTVEKEKFYNYIKFLKNACNSLSIFDTICQATKIRQNETVTIAQKSDLMVIIGGKNSSNTLELYNKSKNVQENTILIEDLDSKSETPPDGELNMLKNMLYTKTKKIKVVGVTAGASTPASSIEEVISVCQMKEF